MPGSLPARRRRCAELRAVGGVVHTAGGGRRRPARSSIDRQPNRPVELPRAAARLADAVERRARREREHKDVVSVPVGHKDRLRTRSEARWTTQRVIRLCAEDSPRLPRQSKDAWMRGSRAACNDTLVVGDNEVQGALEPSRCSARRRRIAATVETRAAASPSPCGGDQRGLPASSTYSARRAAPRAAVARTRPACRR